MKLEPLVEIVDHNLLSSVRRVVSSSRTLKDHQASLFQSSVNGFHLMLKPDGFCVDPARPVMMVDIDDTIMNKDGLPIVQAEFFLRAAIAEGYQLVLATKRTLERHRGDGVYVPADFSTVYKRLIEGKQALGHVTDFFSGLLADCPILLGGRREHDPRIDHKLGLAWLAENELGINLGTCVVYDDSPHVWPGLEEIGGMIVNPWVETDLLKMGPDFQIRYACALIAREPVNPAHHRVNTEEPGTVVDFDFAPDFHHDKPKAERWDLLSKQLGQCKVKVVRYLPGFSTPRRKRFFRKQKVVLVCLPGELPSGFELETHVTVATVITTDRSCDPTGVIEDLSLSGRDKRKRASRSPSVSPMSTPSPSSTPPRKLMLRSSSPVESGESFDFFKSYKGRALRMPEFDSDNLNGSEEKASPKTSADKYRMSL